MNARLTLVAALVVAFAVGIGYHVRLRHAHSSMIAEEAALAQRLAGLNAEQRDSEQEIATLRSKREAQRKAAPGADVARRRETSATPTAVSTSDNATTAQSQMSTLANSPELRRMRVQAFVGEQRLTFAATLHQLGLTPQQLDRFDTIQAEYQEAALDLASTAKAQGITNPAELAPLRRQVVETRDAELRDLFGERYAAWQEANHTQSARTVVGDMLQQTYQSTGPIESSQLDLLTAIVARHPMRQSGSGYDWNAIAEETAAALPGKQADAFNQAAHFKALSDQMYATSGKRN